MHIQSKVTYVLGSVSTICYHVYRHACVCLGYNQMLNNVVSLEILQQLPCTVAMLPTIVTCMHQVGSPVTHVQLAHISSNKTK